MTAQTEIRIGSEFVGYRLDALIGRGGMGVVYRAYDLRLKRTVALKLMAPELALDQRFRERFSREAEVAMSLEHPNVVPIHDAGDIDGRLYLAMRHVEGTDLKGLLQATGALEPTRALAICSQVAHALDAAHAKGLVHRDVKPSNVLLDANEHVYLADFGLTRRSDEPHGTPGEGRSVGTPSYLAPEQIEGTSIDGRTDVYSLGCLLYECLTGEPPFVSGSRLAMAWAHLEEEPPSASGRRPELPDAIDAVIRKAMAKEPGDRYPTCTALIAAAEGALGLRRPQTLRGHKLLLLAAFGAVLVLAAALVAFAFDRGGAAAPAVRANTLVRIDPRTNKVDAVVDVGPQPVATAVGGRSIWVFNYGGPSVTEIDPATRHVLDTARVSISPPVIGALAGPVLAADPGGAWLIGVDQRGRSQLTRIPAGGRGKRGYRLEGKPLAVAVGYGAVWVVTNGSRENEVLRLDPATGKVTGRTRFPTSAPIDGLTVGLGSVWVVASASASLYRIDPHSTRLTGQADLGEHATRPNLVFGAIWVDLSDRGGDTVRVDPRTVKVVEDFGCCPSWQEVDAVAAGSLWTVDQATGLVVRWDRVTQQDIAHIQLTTAPFYRGLCLTAVAAAADAVWVTVAPNDNFHC